jgi:hypothetical protein
VLVAVCAWLLLRAHDIIGMDTATAFYPWYAFLGASLRAGHIPVWNPHTFSGAPFAADPESGWMYLPAMLLFTLLPAPQAFNASIVVHLALAALATYGLARALHIPPIGAAAAGAAYTCSGFFFGHNVCCFAYSNVAAWLPVTLLGVQHACAARAHRIRLLGWAIGALGLSQILAAWVGQGAYYSLLVIGSFLLYRARRTRKWPRSVALNGAAVLVLGAGLAAAGLLPRLEYNAVSNLPGGYPALEQSSTRASLADWGVIEDWDMRLLAPGYHYLGGATLALGLAAPLVAGRRNGVPYFAGLAAVTLVAARWTTTPLHDLLGILPAFGSMHAHAPERALIVFFLAPALLAGATIGSLGRRIPRRAFGVGVVGSGIAWWLSRDPVIPLTTIGWFVLAAAWLVVALARPSRAAAAGALLVLVVDLRLAWQQQFADSLLVNGAYQLQRVDLATYYAPTAATTFLQPRSGTTYARYLGYAGHVLGGPVAYTLEWSDPHVIGLEVDNRALVSGLYDIQGYNPLHIARYDAYMTALNRQTQNYHQTDVFEAGLSSPLLDVLGVRYILTPTTPKADERAPQFERPLATVYADSEVTVFDNPTALPRAWLVHSAQQMEPSRALEMLASGAVDPREVALLEEVPPPLKPVNASNSDQVWIAHYSTDAVDLQVSTDADGLVILSDIAYPAWHAWLDGAPVHVFTTDGALRAVAVPPGAHRIEFRYASAALSVGLIVSLVTVIGLAAAVVWSLTHGQRAPVDAPV